MIIAALTGLSCAIVGFLLPFMTLLALANASPKTDLEARTFRNVTLIWCGTLVASFGAIAWLFAVLSYYLTT